MIEDEEESATDANNVTSETLIPVSSSQRENSNTIFTAS